MLKNYIESNLLNGRPVTNDENLLLSGLLDSLAVVSIVGFVEEAYSIKIPFGDVVIENFMSIDAMHDYLRRKGVGDV